MFRLVNKSKIFNLKVIMHKRFGLLVMVLFLLCGITVTQAATTYVDCGKSANTKYSTIKGVDNFSLQRTRCEWRHTGTTVVYIKDIQSGQTYSKGCSEDYPIAEVALTYSKERPHYHYGTDHQN